MSAEEIGTSNPEQIAANSVVDPIMESAPPLATRSNVDFLFNTYTHTQQTIQFIDTKAGAFIAVNGVFASLIANGLTKVLSELLVKDSIVSRYLIFPAITIMALLFLVMVLQVFYQSFLVLLPREGTKLIDKGNAVGLFWASNLVEFLHEHDLNEYAETVSKMDQDAVIREMSYEAAKLAKISSIKIKHLQKTTSHSMWAMILWAVLLISTGIVEILLPILP